MNLRFRNRRERRCSVLPTQVHRLIAPQGDVNGAIHRRCCTGQDAHYRVGIGSVVEEAALEAVAENDLLSQMVVQLGGDSATQYRVENSLRPNALAQLQTLIAAITIMFVKVVICGDHTESAVAIAHR